MTSISTRTSRKASTVSKPASVPAQAPAAGESETVAFWAAGCLAAQIIEASYYLTL